MSHAFSIRRLRVSGCLAELIEKIQSRRAIGVMSSHPACPCRPEFLAGLPPGALGGPARRSSLTA